MWTIADFEGTGRVLEMDVIRCRRNALSHSAHDFSVFCVYDNIVPSQEGVLADFSFVEMPADGRRNKLTLLPYTVAGRYHRVAVEHLLSYQICTWADIKFSLDSTCKIGTHAVERVLAQMEDAWNGDVDMAKHSINCMIGLWATDHDYCYTCKTSRNLSDRRGSHNSTPVYYGNGECIYDFIFRTRIMSNSSYRPVHDQIMHTEAVHMARLVHCVRGVSPLNVIKHVKTDALLLEGHTEKAHKQLQALCDELQYKDLPDLRNRFQKRPRGQTELFPIDLCSRREGDTASVYRHFGANNASKCRGRPSSPVSWCRSYASARLWWTS